MSENLEYPRRPVLLWITPLAVLVAAFMAFFFASDEWNTGRIIFQVALSAMALGLVVATIWPSKGWWGLRIFTFVVLAAYLWYLVDMLWLSGQALSATARRSEASPFNAILGFLFFGIPCLLYTVWGSTWGRLGHRSSEEATRTDIAMYVLAWAAQGLFLVLSALVIVTALARAFGAS